MSQQPLDQYRKWRDELVLALRMDDVPGDRIGDILLEVETHVRQTGETPLEAFGPAKAYAKERATAADYRGKAEDDAANNHILLIAIASFVGAALYADGAMSIGAGSDAMFGLHAWIALVLGAVLLLILLVRLPADLVRHPATGAPLLGDLRYGRWIVGGVIIALGLVLYIIGTMLG